MPFCLSSKGSVFIMYKQFQLPSRLHYYLCIVLAIMSNILLSSCSTTLATGTPTPVVSPVSTSISTPHLAVTSVSTPTPTSSSAARTVFLIMMENHNWSDIKNSPSAPYINSTLLPTASYAEQYYNPPGIHPSEPNYIWLEAGNNFGILNDDSSNRISSTNHLVTQLNKAGISWRSYQEDITTNSDLLVDQNNYVVRHDPVVLFNDVNGNTAYLKSHVRPYSEFATDLQSNTVGRYNFITPNLTNDMHSLCSGCSSTRIQGDHWLSLEIPKILASQAYTNNGAIFITWDEGDGSSSDGPIGMIVLSPRAKGHGYASSTHFTHSSTLR